FNNFGDGRLSRPGETGHPERETLLLVAGHKSTSRSVVNPAAEYSMRLAAGRERGYAVSSAYYIRLSASFPVPADGLVAVLGLVDWQEAGSIYGVLLVNRCNG